VVAIAGMPVSYHRAQQKDAMSLLLGVAGVLAAMRSAWKIR
jgi:hypothetical protein